MSAGTRPPLRTSLVVSWVAALVVFAGALVVAAVGDTGPRTQSEQVYAIAATLKCPQCAGQTVAESDTAISREIRGEISDGLAAGRSPDEIRTDIAAGYEVEIRLDPTSSGVTGLVWMLPVVGAVLAGAGLVFAFRRWSGQGTVAATDDDRALVDAALAVRHAETGDGHHAEVGGGRHSEVGGGRHAGEASGTDR